MSKLKLFFGAVGIIVLCFCFSSYFALSALAKLYTNFLNKHDQPNVLGSQFVLSDIDAFTNQQLYIALSLIFGIVLVTMMITAWQIPREPGRWSIKTIGFPLFLVSSFVQLIALGLYINNFIKIISVPYKIEAELVNAFVEISTTFIISALLFFELLILLIKLLQSDKNQVKFRLSIIDPYSIRPAIFLFLFGVDLSAAFVPLHMNNLYQPILDLPKDVVLGLPISAMFLCVSFTIIVAGIWVDRRGWHEPFLVGVTITSSAMLYAWLAPNAIHFVVAMSLAGLGYGLALMASQGFVISYSDSKTKARGLAYLFAGIYAGSICGTAVGAMLAERIGYTPIFLLSALILLLTLGYTFLAMRVSIEKSKLHAYEAGAQKIVTCVTAKCYWAFMQNRYVLGLIFLSSLPSAIAVIGLLNYFGPVYLNRLGVSQSVIGSVLIIYSICMVYLGPYISKFIDSSDNKQWYVFIGCLLGSCAFFSFHFFSGLIATVVAVLILGLSSCFVLASQTTYALTLDVTKQLGQGRAIGIFRASSRIGQMLGPILFGWLMTATDISQGLTLFGVIYFAAATLFALLTFERRKYKAKVICE